VIANIPYIAAMAMVVIGIYACVFRRNLIKVILGVALIESGANMFLITLGYRGLGSIAPIYTNAPATGNMTLPIPQALTLTSIVIGVAVLALMISFAVSYYKKTGTLDTRKGVLKE